MADIVVIGAGHNGLICAAYLAKAGHKVTIFEQHTLLGGAARTDDQTFPGYKLSTCSYVNALFDNKIVEDLNLKRFGYEILTRNPSFLKLFPGGEYLSLGKDKDENRRQISKFDWRDALVYEEYVETNSRLGAYFDPYLLQTPPRMPPRSFSDVGKLLWAAGHTLAMGRDMVRLVELVTTDAQTYLAKKFRSEAMRSAMYPDATIGSFDNPSLLLLMLHQNMGFAGGERGVWGFQRGGMGGISKAIAGACKVAGVEIYLDCSVKAILFSPSGVANGILLENGERVAADIVVSNATPHETFTRLVPKELIPSGYLRRVEATDYSSGVMKVNMIVSGPPHVRALSPGSQFHWMKGTIHISPTMEYIEKALYDARNGLPAEKPMIEMTIPSIIDDSLAPYGHHVIGMFVQYVPYLPKDGEWTEDRKRRYLHENIFNVMRQYISNIDDIFIDAQILAPPDIYRLNRMTGGNIFHGAMKLSQMYWNRYSYQTPMSGVWLCGAGTHPGGGVMGACGHNAAREILKSLKSS